MKSQITPSASELDSDECAIQTKHGIKYLKIRAAIISSARSRFSLAERENGQLV